jgi:phosphate-selective porin OprO/OprP
MLAPGLAVRGAAQEKKEDKPTLEKKDAPPPDFVVRVTGYVQLDGRFFQDEGAGAAADTFVLRRVRPIVQGTVARFFDFYIMTDFGGGVVVLQDAYLDARYVPWLRVRAGKLKEPVGIERLQSGSALTFVERALPTAIVPNRDLGVQVHGDIAKGVVSYAAGVFNGVPDGGSVDVDVNDGKDVAGRLFLSPFKRGSIAALKDLGFGIAGTRGRQEGALPTYRTSGQQAFFTYATGVTALGTRTRVSPQASYQGGPIRLIGEYARSRQRVVRGNLARDVTNRAWQAAASIVLTGEAPVAGVVTPKHPFEPGKGGWGALEVAARYTALEVGDEAFRAALADPTRSARKAQAWAVGLNWHLNKNVRQVVNFERTTFTGGAAAGDRAPENAILIRTQISY